MFTCPWFKVEMHSLEKSVIPYHSHSFPSLFLQRSLKQSHIFKNDPQEIAQKPLTQMRGSKISLSHCGAKPPLGRAWVSIISYYFPSFSPVTSSGYSNTIFGGMNIHVHPSCWCSTGVSSLGDPPDPWDDVRLDELSKSMDGRLLELEKSSRAAVPWFVGMVGLGLGGPWWSWCTHCWCLMI